MSIESILTMIAILLAPLIAIQISVYLEERREKRKIRLDIFTTLMSTRANRLSAVHVQALNSIEVAFYGKNRTSKEVVDAWKVYLKHLANAEFKDKSLDAWLNKGSELLVDLLAKMAADLDYDFDRSSIMENSYTPEYFGKLEDEFMLLRKALVALLLGEKSLPIVVKSDEPNEDQERLREAYKGIVTGEKPFKVKIVKDE